MLIVAKESEVRTMSPRTGRPKLKNPKDIVVRTRFDKKSHEELIKYCVKNNITRTDAIRKGVKLLVGKQDETKKNA